MEIHLDGDVQKYLKTICDRFNRLITELKETNKTNELTSGNVEVRMFNMDQALENMIQDKEQFEEEKKKKRVRCSFYLIG